MWLSTQGIVTFVKDTIFDLVRKFSGETHGSSNLADENIFVMGGKSGEYMPLSYAKKHLKNIKTEADLQKEGFLFSSLDYLESGDFFTWYKDQFGKKLSIKQSREVGVLYHPNQRDILEAISIADRAFEILKNQHVLMNGKNLPVQLGEWFAKSIFGLRQIKSSSQRGFDFYTNDMKRVEVKVHWNDFSSPKGVKLKKSYLELSDYAIVMYISKNLMIRDILFLDSNYILRKFGVKGHTIFLKDSEVSHYFFSVSDKHFERMVNKNMLMRFANTNLVMKLSDSIGL